MSKITLFDAAQQVREAISQIDPGTGELTDSYSDSRELFQTKAIACVAYVKDEAVTIEAAEAAIKQMAAIKAGEAVAGASIIRRDRLSIT